MTIFHGHVLGELVVFLHWNLFDSLLNSRNWDEVSFMLDFNVIDVFLLHRNVLNFHLRHVFSYLLLHRNPFYPSFRHRRTKVIIMLRVKTVSGRTGRNFIRRRTSLYFRALSDSFFNWLVVLVVIVSVIGVVVCWMIRVMISWVMRVMGSVIRVVIGVVVGVARRMTGVVSRVIGITVGRMKRVRVCRMLSSATGMWLFVEIWGRVVVLADDLVNSFLVRVLGMPMH